MPVSVVVVTWNSAEDIGACLASVAAQQVDVEVVVVDNGSTDTTREVVDAAPVPVELVELGANTGYARASNVGVDATTGDLVLLLNPDVVLDPGCLSDLVAVLERRPDAVGVGARLRNTDGSLQLAALRDPGWIQLVATMTGVGRRLDRRLGHRHERHRTYRDEWEQAGGQVFPVDVQIGACLLLRRVHLPPGPFDERFPLYFNDGDLCRRVRAHGPLLVDPRAGAAHRRGTSTARVPHPRLRAEFYGSLFRYTDRWWSWGASASLRIVFLVDAVLHELLLRARRRDPGTRRQAIVGGIGLPGGAAPWFGPPAGVLPDRTMRRRAVT